MRKETKIGILLTVCIVVLIWGLKFLKGQNILNSSQTFYVEYPYAAINPSTPVQVSGQQVGVVTDVYLKPDDLRTVVMEINIENEMPLPKNTEVQIVTSSVLGDKIIRLSYDGPCSGADCAESGTYLQGRNLGMVESMIDTESIDDLMSRMKAGAAGVYDTLATKMSGGGAESEMVTQVKDIIKNLDVMTRQINSLLYKSSDSMAGMMENMENITANIAKNNAQITGIIANAEKLTATLSQTDIDGTMKSTKGMMDKANETMAGFDKTLVSAKASMDELTELFGGMNDSKGSLGKMLKDDDFYDNMTSATRNLDLLLQDFRLNPKRYTTVLKKKSPVYVLPADDPAVKKE